MEIRQLRTFHTVATLNSFRKAAKSLGYAQSTVSAQIQNLEEDLGVKVFERAGKKFSLTQEGERLLEYALRMVELEDEARRKVVSGQNDTAGLRLIAGEYFCTSYLSDIISQLQDFSAFLQCSITALDRQSTLEMLRDERADAALRYGSSEGFEEFRNEVVLKEPFVLVGRRRLQLSGQLMVSDADLASQTLLVLGSERECVSVVEQALNERSVTFNRRVELDSLAALLRFAVAGVGVSFLPLSLARQEQKAGRLSIVGWEGDIPELPLYLITRKNVTGSSLPNECLSLIRGLGGVKE